VLLQCDKIDTRGPEAVTDFTIETWIIITNSHENVCIRSSLMIRCMKLKLNFVERVAASHVSMEVYFITSSTHTASALITFTQQVSHNQSHWFVELSVQFNLTALLGTTSCT
jgi:hypothetical protein